MADENKSNETSPPHSKGGGVAIIAGPAEREKADREREKTEEREYKNEQRSLQRRMLSTQIGLVAAAIIGGSFTYWQLQIAQQSADTSDKSILLAQKSERDARLMGEKQLAQSQASLRATIDQFRQDQRAWVGNIHTTNPGTKDAVGNLVYLVAGKHIDIEVQIINSGRTPARQVNTRGVWKTQINGTAFMPTYPKLSVDAPVARSKSVLQPNGTITIPVASEGESLSQHQIDGVMQGKLVFYLYGRVTYRDVFGGKRITTFCYFLDRNIRQVSICETYNTAN